MELQPKNLASQLQCTTKDSYALYLKGKKNIYIILFCVHTDGQNFFFFFSFSSFPISTRCSSLPSIGPHTLHFFPLQGSTIPLATNPSPCPTPTMLIDLFVLHPYLSAISFFLYPIFQSFSVSNTKTHARQCWVLILLS